MSHVISHGIKIHYQIEGTGPPLILLHGMFDSIESWYDNGYVDKLRTEYKLILIDQRGCIIRSMSSTKSGACRPLNPK